MTPLPERLLRTARSFLIGAIGGGMALMITGRPVLAQARDSVPCCLVVRVDTVRLVVTARETATGYTFRFEVKAKKVVAALKVGDKVWANFAMKKVRVAAAGDSLCCAIIETPPRVERLTRTNP